MESGEEISYKIRMYPEWDDVSYQECIRLVMAVVNDDKDTEFIPRALMYFFVSRLPQIIGAIAHPIPAIAVVELEEVVVSPVVQKGMLASLWALFFNEIFSEMALVQNNSYEKMLVCHKFAFPDGVLCTAGFI